MRRQSQLHLRRSAFLLLPFCVILTGLLCSISAFADEKKEEKKPAASTEKEYLIGVDDVITITAVGQDEINQTVTVLPDGKIRVNGIDEDIQAEGLTVGKLRERIFKGLDRLYANLELSVSVKESRSRNVSIIGTKMSGMFPLRKGMRVSALIALGGGVPGKSKLVVGSLTRNFKLIKLNMGKIIGPTPDTESDLLLEPNDTVILDVVEDAPPPAYSVLGQVSRPGSAPLPLDGSSVTVARAIADAGGQTEKAALTRVVLQRQGQKTPLNLYPLLIEGKADVPESKIELQNGDILIVPELDRKVLVLGQVNKAGPYALPEAKPLTLLDALAIAGGQTQTAEMRHATLTRTVNGKTTVVQVNIQRMMTNKNDLSLNIPLQPDDILWIPQRGRPQSNTDIFNPLVVLGALGLRPF